MEGWRGRSGYYLLVFGLIRISRWIDDEEERTKGKGEMGVQYVVFDMGAVSSIDTSGTSMLAELKKSMDRRGMQWNLGRIGRTKRGLNKGMDGDRSEVQRLYDACGAVFSPRRGGGLPTLTQIRWLQDILDGMKAADVGIDAGAGDGERSSSSSSDDERSPRGRRFLPARAFTRITYVHIHECDDFSIGVFCFPAGAKLPLHDHTHMAVLSKLLYFPCSTQPPSPTARPARPPSPRPRPPLRPPPSLSQPSPIAILVSPPELGKNT